MKNFILAAAVLALLASCDKNKNTIVASDENIENTNNSEPLANTKDFQLPTFSTNDMVEYLADKKNDTLYVTNFFATWCGPCMQEIPHFIKKKNELKDQPVKFTFVSIDSKDDWETKVKAFATKSKLVDNIVLLDGNQLDEAFYKNNFKTWDGRGIPFTIIKKGDKREEIYGFTSEETLNERINALK